MVNRSPLARTSRRANERRRSESRLDGGRLLFLPPPPEEAASAAGVRLFVLLGDGYTVQLCLIRASHPRVADTIHMVKNAGSRWFNLIFPEQINEI